MIEAHVLPCFENKQKKEKHVKILQKFNDRKLNEGRVKNQIVMDALEMYFNALENKKGTEDDKLVSKYFLEQWLEKLSRSVGKKF